MWFGNLCKKSSIKNRHLTCTTSALFGWATKDAMKSNSSIIRFPLCVKLRNSRLNEFIRAGVANSLQKKIPPQVKAEGCWVLSGSLIGTILQSDLFFHHHFTHINEPITHTT